MDSTSRRSSESMDSTSTQSSESRSKPTGFSIEEKERERALRASETAEQKEEKLRKQKMRDSAKWATKASEGFRRKSGSLAAKKGKTDIRDGGTESGQAAEDACQ